MECRVDAVERVGVDCRGVGGRRVLMVARAVEAVDRVEVAIEGMQQ